jgi:hypothetical protein
MLGHAVASRQLYKPEARLALQPQGYNLVRRAAQHVTAFCLTMHVISNDKEEWRAMAKDQVGVPGSPTRIMRGRYAVRL